MIGRRAPSKKGTIAKVLMYAGHYRALIVVSLLCALISVALTLYVPVLTGQAIDSIIEAGRVDFYKVGAVVVKIALAVAVTALSQWAMNVVNNLVTYETVREIRGAAFQKLWRLPLAYLDGKPTGELVSRVIADVDQFADGLLMGFTQLFTGVITILGTLVFMLMTDVKITLVVVVITPLSLLVAAFIAKRTYDMFRLQAEARADQTAYVEEMIAGQKVVRAFGREAQVAARFDEIGGVLEKASLDAIFYSSITNPATRFVNALVYAGVGIAGAFSALFGGITVGALTAFLSYANQYTKPFNEISGVVTELTNALNCAARVFELIEEELSEEDAPGVRALTSVKGDVALENVCFAYKQDQPLIENVNLEAHPGARVAIVGPTGCGKTTLINLLLRFYDVDMGAVTVDGQDVRGLKRASLRRHYGMVLQETWLKRGTVRENIALGKPSASDAEIEEAARAAHAHSFIKRLPEGYSTMIGEADATLSEGQKQLLSIARVMLCLPEMLILDEATSSIDTRTERKIQDAFSRMTKGRTSFIVAHRLSTIENANLIVVMNAGHVVEQGTHEELLRRGGFYAALYNSQFAH